MALTGSAKFCSGVVANRGPAQPFLTICRFRYANAWWKFYKPESTRDKEFAKHNQQSVQRIEGLQEKAKTGKEPTPVQKERTARASHPPSWVPPDPDRPDLGYMVKRSAFGNMPVYTDYRNGGTKKLTIIRRINGDIMKLETDLKESLGKVYTHVDEMTGHITIRGLHTNRVTQWLYQKGF